MVNYFQHTKNIDKNIAGDWHTGSASRGGMTTSQQTTGAGAFKERFKELANRAQEAGKQFAAQVKDQQQKLIENRTKSHPGKVVGYCGGW